MLEQLAITAHDEVLGALRRIGRTEDATFSSDGQRLAIAGFADDSIVLLDLVIEDKPGSAAIAISGLTHVWSPALRDPHGVAFLGQRAIVVANRAGEAPIFDLPPPSVGIRRVNVEPIAIVGPGSAAELTAPGSVRATELAPDLHEVLICDNQASIVSRHVVDLRDGAHVVAGDVLAACGLATPDSLALSHDRAWLAVSNHDTHSVLLFGRPGELRPDRWADGVLENVTYPHGLAFTAAGTHVIVADAGAPFLHVYARGPGDWSGVRQPVRSVRVMDDETFMRGRYNIQEGGPKGLDINHETEVVVVSSEHQPLVFFDLADVLGPDSGADAAPDNAADEHVRAALLRELRSASDARRDADQQRQEAAAGAAHAADLTVALTDLERRCDELTVRVAEAIDATERVTADLATAREEASHAAAAARRAEAELRTALDTALAEHEVAAAHVANLEAVVADRDLQMEALRASTSWRLTAPLRWASAIRQGRRAPASPR